MNSRGFHRLFGIFWIVLLLWACPSLAQKTDIVILRNGDTITGEIKALDRGKLRYKTDDMSTIYIEWDKIVQITSKHFFEIELRSGERLFGVIPESPEPGKMQVVSTILNITLDMHVVVGMTPVKSTFWSRFDGYVDLGFSYTKADQLTTWTGSGEVRHRTRNFLFKLNGDSYLSYRKQESEEEEEKTSRNSIGFIAQRFFGRNWSAFGLARMEQNDELSLDLRTTVGGGAGRALVQTNRVIFSLHGGLVSTREHYAGEEEGKFNLESVASATFELFKYDVPEMDITVNFLIFPSLTDWGRVRTNLDTKLKIEVFKDFFWAFSFFDITDSRPQTEEASNHDYGLTTSLGWKF